MSLTNNDNTTEMMAVDNHDVMPHIFDVSNLPPEEIASIEEQIHREQDSSRNMHFRLRREKALYLLTHPASLYYTSKVTGQSMEYLRIRLLRLMDANVEDTPEAEQRDFDGLMEMVNQFPSFTDFPKDLTILGPWK